MSNEPAIVIGDLDLPSDGEALQRVWLLRLLRLICLAPLMARLLRTQIPARTFSVA